MQLATEPRGINRILDLTVEAFELGERPPEAIAGEAVLEPTTGYAAQIT